MSAAARRRIALAQKERWAAARAQKAEAEKPAAGFCELMGQMAVKILENFPSVPGFRVFYEATEFIPLIRALCGCRYRPLPSPAHCLAPLD